MIRKTTFIIGLFFTLSGYSQNYLRMINDSIFWDVNCAVMGYICNGYGGQGERLFFGEDTLINDTSFTKVKAYKLISIYVDPSCPPFEVDTIFYYKDYFLYESPDSNIYVHDGYYNETELLFDYKLNVGDTFIYPYYDSFIVDSIYSITTTDGITRKVWEYNNVYSSAHGYFIEGLGGPAGPIYAPFYYFEGGHWLDNWGYFGSNLNNPWSFLTTSINTKYFNSKIEIYPNPANNLLSIKTKKEIVKIKIYNISGIEVKKVINHQTKQINIESLKEGIYFIEITLKDGETIKRKFIKNSL